MFKTFFIVFSLFIVSVAPLFAAERETIFGPESYTVTKDSSFLSQEVAVSEFEDVILQFDFDITALDKMPSQDVLVYGWVADGVEHELGRIDGLTNADPAEIDSVTVPVEMSGVVQVYAEVIANTSSDKAVLSNVMLTGIKKESPVCSIRNGNMKDIVARLKSQYFTRGERGEWNPFGQYVRQEVRNCLPFKAQRG